MGLPPEVIGLLGFVAVTGGAAGGGVIVLFLLLFNTQEKPSGVRQRGADA